MAKAPSLNDRQAEFVRQYLVDLNATQAAIRAGYSPKTANRNGPRLLSNAVVAAAVTEAMAKRAEETKLSADSVVQELARLAFANMLDYIRITQDGDPAVDLSRITRDQAAAILEVQVEDYLDGRGEDAREVRRVKFKLADKKGALELLGKHLQMFTERVDVTSKGEKLEGAQVQVYLPANGRDGAADG